jgi:transcriptional regulator with XRE-family HTH domain
VTRWRHGATTAEGRSDTKRPAGAGYQIRYTLNVTRSLLASIRESTGLSQAELAGRAGTSRPTLSAYEHGRISPTLDTFERILAAAGYQLRAVPAIVWREVEVGRGRIAAIPDRLPDLNAVEALRRLVLPLHLAWSGPQRTVDLSERQQRALAYEIVLREGRPVDVESIVDGALLVDLWNELVLPRRLRTAWQPLIDDVTEPEASRPRIRSDRSSSRL